MLSLVTGLCRSKTAAERERKSTRSYLLVMLGRASLVAEPVPPGSCGHGFCRHRRQRAEGGHQLRRNF